MTSPGGGGGRSTKLVTNGEIGGRGSRLVATSPNQRKLLEDFCAFLLFIFLGSHQFAIIANCMDMLYLAKLANISPWYLCGETRQLVGNFSCHIYYMWQKSRTSRRVSPHIIYLAKVANQLWYLCGKTRQLVRNIYLPDILYVAKVANQLASFATYNTSGQSH